MSSLHPTSPSGGATGARIERRRSSQLPTGTVTFLFTDIEGSTARWQRYGEEMQRAVARHDELIRAAIELHSGHIFKTGGDGFCAVFATAPDALAAALRAQRNLHDADFTSVDGMRVRMALHSGRAEERDNDYFGLAINRVARLLALAHGSQVLLSGAVADLAADELPEHVRLRDLGEHRLRDLETLERVFQLQAPDLPADFPTLRSLDARPNNLPAQLTRFVGRAQEVADLKQALTQTRLLTLAGSGGVGKTRLSLQIAAETLELFPDGVWIVELAAISDGELVAAHTAQVLEAPVSGTRPVLQSVLSALRYKTALLIFDSCEHLLTPVSTLIDEVLRNCPNVKLLATTQQALDIDGETVHHVGTLDVPPPTVETAAEAARYSAVQLFTDRAQAASSRFALTDQNASIVANICRRVDGIALAIELAAPQVALLCPRQLEEKLNERFKFLTRGKRTALPRQQTLRALFDWSYDLLDERERRLFRRLAAFSGGWDLDGLSAICGDDTEDAFDLLASLVAKSLVLADPFDDVERYRLLGSTREYARELLLASEDAQTGLHRHAVHYRAHVGSALPLVESMDDDGWQRIIGLELDNIRAALDWSLASDDDQRLGLELLGDLERFRLVMTPHEALRWYERGATLVRRSADIGLAPKIFRQYYTALFLAAQPAEIRESVAQETLAAARLGSDPLEIAQALWRLGHAQTQAGNYDAAHASFTEAWQTLGDVQHRRIRASMLVDWAHVDLKRNDGSSARARMAEVVKLATPGSIVHAHALIMLGELEFLAGHTQAAKAVALEAREAFAAHDSQVNATLASANLAAYAMAAGQLDEARHALADALTILRTFGANVYTAQVIEQHALYAGLTGNHDDAVVLLGYSSAQLARLGQVRAGSDDLGYNQLQALLANYFTEEEIKARMSSGSILQEEQVLARAAAMHQAHETAQGSAAQPRRSE
jgi:predicted ATPase/class 3 adenylate cyclase